MRASDLTKRERLMICGLFLSKFDRLGLDYLGFKSFLEAFNVLGYGLQSKPSTIKNYRDEFDPQFPNNRTGWNSRELRPHCADVLNEFGGLALENIGLLVRSFLMPEACMEAIPILREEFFGSEASASSAFAKRAITGRSAERYFASRFSSFPEFQSCSLVDTTSWGCGFDFRMERESGKGFFAVEVKGLREKRGSIQITDLEYRVAESLRHDYFLVVVRNFAESPTHTVIQDPTKSELKLTRSERITTEIKWNTNVG